MKLEDIDISKHKNSRYILYDSNNNIVGSLDFGVLILNRYYHEGSDLCPHKYSTSNDILFIDLAISDRDIERIEKDVLSHEQHAIRNI